MAPRPDTPEEPRAYTEPRDRDEARSNLVRFTNEVLSELSEADQRQAVHDAFVIPRRDFRFRSEASNNSALWSSLPSGVSQAADDSIQDSLSHDRSTESGHQGRESAMSDATEIIHSHLQQLSRDANSNWGTETTTAGPSNTGTDDTEVPERGRTMRRGNRDRR